MKKVVLFFALALMLVFSINNSVPAQDIDTAAATADTSSVMDADTASTEILATDTEGGETKSFHQVLKQKFIEGGAGWMAPILVCLILGLALAIERILYLNFSTTNTAKLLNKVETALESQGISAAKDICRDTKGPVASVFYQGLDRYNEGIDVVEKSIVSYGGVLMARLEKNLSWITLFIALAPMLGFLGTVVGMVRAFESIEIAGDISPTIVAAGMKVALLTTVFGLIVAIILQILFNYLVTKVESLVNSMEDVTISFIDILVKYKNAKK